jgi:NAD(P)-dependent dehydrogenase (short-subunit alcohol dehydrogenase family)
VKWTHQDIPEQDGKSCIVTGANTGIGYETARALARKGAHVILACRDQGRGTAAAEDLSREGPRGHVELAILDLADLDSIRAFSDRFMDNNDKLDLLINNAGVMMCPECRTRQGYELQFGVNHLGHFALTVLLLPCLRAAARARVVTVSSRAHRSGKVVFEDLHFRQRGYDAMAAYAQSKLANLLFTFEMQRRLERAGGRTIAVAAHPGWTKTGLTRHIWYGRMLNPIFGMSSARGALPTLRAATAPDVKGGEYYGPSGFLEMRGYPKRLATTEIAKSPEDAARLWSVSKELTGVTGDP